MSEIRNKVAESGLISLDLADYKPKIIAIGIDTSEQLWQGLVLKEKDFRAWIKAHDWESYLNKAVFIHCSVDAIVPTWAYMLIASQLELQKTTYVVGTALDLEKKMIHDQIQQEDLNRFKDGRVIIKGCADVAEPEYAMVELVKFIQPVAKSIMYGEPCSTVPVFKRKNK